MVELLKLLWHKAGGCESGACVEVARVPDGRVAVRDSKNPLGGALVFTPQQWDEFLAGAARGEFDPS
ncbi:DUF397 domain-containing protein [Nocardia sp. 2]|uniref:DUF397 domain-containing protein n=1 Tax=Nocardia acididurans TaxID=2802282 RepID=A0ABS1MHF9_9NOCA|nr:DUF397 domain-containing protein [Nocardia acididurans]